MKLDKARQATDKKLKEMEQKVSDIYQQAQKEITEDWNKYMEQGEKKLSALLEKEGADSDKYKNALKNYTLNDARYKDMVGVTTAKLAHSNEVALAYVKDQMPEVYATNYNQMGIELKNAGLDSHDGVSFNLVDEHTVRRMIKDGDIKMPNQEKRLKIPKDQRWNTKQINSAVLQGILQGESIDKIAKRLLPIIGNNEKAAIRNARTLVTGAENRGRLDSYRDTADMGIVQNKVWMATSDGRTRDIHLDMDGQEVGIEESFEDGVSTEIMYPGDPSGAPESVYNCRCCMVTHIVGFRGKDGTINKINYDAEPSEHDKAIEKEKGRRNTEKKNNKRIRGK